MPGGPVRWLAIPLVPALLLVAGCHEIVRQTDRDVAAVIRERQQAALREPIPIELGELDSLPSPGPSAYRYTPNPTDTSVPEEFTTTVAEPTSQPTDTTSQPVGVAASRPTSQPTATAPITSRGRIFTVTDALAYAQQHRREYQTAKEDLYLSALALTLERHLWTPIFASDLRAVYGNFGEATDFDQAMRFVADLSVSQRLPYGGEFTAGAVSTLIRDVKRTITASEGSAVSLDLDIPLLRNAGHIAREGLVQLERELTYSVRTFERFRREQMVTVARAYFDLLRSKQQVLDSEQSYLIFIDDFERATAKYHAKQGTLLDAQRAEQAMLSAENSLEEAREAFRSQADRFKLQIGMPVDEPLPRSDLEDIETIERRIADGTYPLLARPQAIDHESRALDVALERRLDRRTLSNRIDDARRGVDISRNALLPDLDWTSSLTFDTDPDHYKLGGFHVDRANWRTEVVLSLPLERTAERNQLRRSLIDLRRAHRSYQQQGERIRVDVRGAVNEILLQERSLEIQRRAVFVAERRREYAKYRFEEIGDISNRDKVEAENEWTNARNRLNLAKTSRWSAILEFRLATETLRIDEDGVQQPDPDLPGTP